MAQITMAQIKKRRERERVKEEGYFLVIKGK